MDDRLYRPLKMTAIALTVAWVAWTAYDARQGMDPAERELAAAVRLLEDRHFEEALQLFRETRGSRPGNLGALRGEAQALMQLGGQQATRARELEEQGDNAGAAMARRQSLSHYEAARAAYDQAIRQEEARGITEDNRRTQGVAHANRGILRDRMGDHLGALEDYETAMRLEPEVAEGPGFLTRFLRNQAEPPPSVADRARYIREQLARPAAERLLKFPQEDEKQRAHRL